MVTKCANAVCNNDFHYLRKGRLFLVPVDDHGPLPSGPQLVGDRKGPQRVEHYWLCDECAERLTLAIDRRLGIVTVPINTPVAKRAAAS
ncbi:MAG TPA: hypothetical protein VLA96_12655 [Terriglobales bacterium]|jgi:hypothetical protein|nr:hypothetical protein [Terriglobales bacterium]